MIRRRSLLVVATLMLVASLASGARAQQPAVSDQAAEASAAFDAKDWAKAAKLYEVMAHANPRIPRLWFRWGTSLQNLGQTDRAIEAYHQALEAGTPPIFAEYALATAYGQKGDAKDALEHLQKAVTAGYNRPEQLESDPHLAPVRSASEFPGLLEQSKKNLTPCAYTTENRQFDFWVGEWNVETTQGAIPAGQSKIERILGDCVILENWQNNGNPYSGKSYNTYNAALKRWEQYWVDNAGGNIFFHGELKDGVMDYWTDDIPQPSGPPLRRHLQFFKLGPDKVRQFSQGSTDGGKTWNVEYDFTYIRTK
jgi:tetratricopeptide (TPR) repeat protein